MTNKSSVELQEELNKALAREKLEKQEKMLKEAEHNYLNKCYSTHNLVRGVRKSIELSLRKVNNVLLSGDNILLSLETITYYRDTDGKVELKYSRGTNVSPHHSWENFRYEITPEQYESAKERASSAADLIGTALREGLTAPQDYINGIVQTEDSAHKTLLEKCNAPLIILPLDITPNNNASIAEMLGWYHHPFLFCGKYLLNSRLSKDILQEIIDTLRKNAYSWGSSILQRDLPRINALENFLKTTKWSEV